MPSFTGGGINLTWGYLVHEDGWGGSYNQNFKKLDAVVQLSVLEILNTPPGSPAGEDSYIVGDTPTGAWVGHETEIAVFTKTETPDTRDWVFFAPGVGWIAFNQDDSTFYYFDGADWLAFPALPGGGTDGQVLTLVAGVPAWDDAASGLPAPGTDGQVLTLVAGVPAWDDPVEELPSGTDGQILKLVAGNPDWVDHTAIIQAAVSDETTAITTGTAKLTFRMPHAMTLTGVRGSLSTVSSSGVVQVDVNKNGTTVFSTELTIDASEKTSVTAATPAVISVSALADDDEITVDIVAAGTGAKGLKVTLLGTRS